MADLIRPELVRPPPVRRQPGGVRHDRQHPSPMRLPRALRLLRRGVRPGITTGDLVRYTHPADGTVTGYATMTNGNTRADASGKKGMKLQAVTLLERGNGYRYGRGPNETPKRD